MSRIIKSRKLVALLSVVAAVGIAAIAYAFLTADGSGTGSGTATASSSDLVLTASDDIALDHIGDDRTFNIYGDNTLGDDPEVLASGLTVTATPNAGCPAGSFTISDITPTGNQVPAGGSGVVVATAKVTWSNVNSAQDDCTDFDLALDTP